MANPNPVHKFVKGESGNPKGRPKRDWTWSGVLENAVERINEDSGKSVKEEVADSLVREALKGNILAQKELMNRMDGMPSQPTEIEGNINIIIDESLKKE